MNLKGEITLLFNSEHGMDIQVGDCNSNITFLQLNVSKENVTKLLAAQAYIPCTLKLNNLDKLGKYHKSKKLEFPVGFDYSKRNPEHLKKLKEQCKKHLPKNYISDNYYNSQDSFFEKDGKLWARVRIRKYSEKKPKQEKPPF